MWQVRGLPADAIVVSDPPTRGTAICPRRLRRAATLIGDKMGPHQYAVRGAGGTVHYVDISADIPCMCKDAEYNGGLQCKHVLYCRMREGDEMVLLALGQMLLKAEEHRKSFLRVTRKLARVGTE